MTSLALGSWLGAHYQAWFPFFMREPWVQLESCRLPLKYTCTVKVTVSCWLLWFTGVIAGWTIDYFPPLKALIRAFWKVGPQGGGIEVNLAKKSLGPVPEVYRVFGNRSLPWITLLYNSKEALPCLLGGFVRYLWLLKEALSAQMRKFHSKYMCIYTLTYMHCNYSSRSLTVCFLMISSEIFTVILPFSFLPLYVPPLSLCRISTNIEEWNLVPSGAYTTQLLPQILRGHCRRRDRRTMRADGRVSLLWDCVS